MTLDDRVELVIVPDPEVYREQLAYRNLAQAINDLSTAANALHLYLQTGIISVNEARARMTIPGGL